MATIRRVSRTRVSYVITDDYTDSTHRSGINALAIDTETHVVRGDDASLADRGGILYSGGRDAVVNSWDLHLGLGKRSHPLEVPVGAEQFDFFGATEATTSAASTSASPGEQAEGGSGPSAPNHAKKLSQSQSSFVASATPVTGVASSPIGGRAALEIPLEGKRRVFVPPATTHRATFRHHTDWVNDIALVNGNRHFVSASNDRTLNLWPSHPPSESDSSYLVGPPTNPPFTPQPHRLGAHTDYVKSLAAAPLANWVASAGTDRRICLWSLQECRPAPVRSLWGVNLYNEGATVVMGEPQASVYAVGTNKVGSILVSGSTEGYVRCWDPRVPRRTVKMVGHTDNVRAVVVSEDGKWVLSASSDATIKLWHLVSPHRCVATWSHSASSVWSLFSTHPTLDVWWAGGKDGWIWKGGRGLEDPSIGKSDSKTRGYDEEPGDVVAVGRESNGVSKLVAIDDLYVWAATSSSSIHRWPDVPFSRTKPVYYTLPTPTTPNEAVSVKSYLYPAFIATVDETTTTAIPPASIIRATGESVLSASKTSVLPTAEPIEDTEDAEVEPASHNPDPSGTIKGKAGIVSWQVLNNRREVAAVDSEGGVAIWDVVRCVKARTLPPHTPLASILADPSINPLDWCATWCTLDARTGVLTIHMEESRAFDAEAYWEDVVKEGVGPEIEDQRVNVGKWILTNLFQNFREACRNPGFKGSQPITSVSTTVSAVSPPRGPNGEVPGGGGARDNVSPANDIAAAVPSNAPSTTVFVPSSSVTPGGTATPSSSAPPTPERQPSSGGEKSGAGTPPATSSGFMDMFKWRKKGGESASADRSRAGTADEDSVAGSTGAKPDHPPLILPPHVPIIVSVEESSEASNFLDLYRGTAATIGDASDVERLRQVIPTWVYEFVVEGKANVKEAVKMSFVMTPAVGSDLPELPNGQSNAPH
ncbi:WD40 repeat-like protein [Gonapodya prolifera JEL478]|uniref:WD40 repeat-like protein n=1 Tax=Gonapodya prolifera (strain JEL478) TaxID=1344416 RepID=A0A139ATA3_GONPJ|nr:WD40 repeat-like protein [Gonapodya prolifera JEL478]|eukprot:KXS19961.1 WD40 repeat-like protein [Gonapodya prolifera JEL478]